MSRIRVTKWRLFRTRLIKHSKGSGYAVGACFYWTPLIKMFTFVIDLLFYSVEINIYPENDEPSHWTL